VASHEVIKNPAEIKECQKMFEQILQQKDIFVEYENKKVTYSGGSRQCDIYWSGKYKFWSASFEYAEKGHRCCNWFGISEDKPGKTLELLVEINFSLCKGTTSGKLIKDGNKIYVTHNGDIGRTSKKDFFWANYNGKRFNNENLALIGELTKVENQEFLESVMNFVEQIRKIKQIAKENGNLDNNKRQNIQRENNVNETSVILIKKNKSPAQNEGKQKLNSNSKREILNKAFDFIIPVLPGFIGNSLQKKDKNTWWQKFVLDNLPSNAVRDLPKKGTYDEYINKLDISLCIKIIIGNWRDVFKYIIRNINFSWVHELIEIRNDVSHWSNEISNKYTFESISHTLNTMMLFMRPIDSNAAGQISELKRGFEDKFENDLDPLTP